MKTRTIAFTFIWVACHLALSTVAVSAEPGISTLKADFVMTRKVAVLKQALSSSGHLALGGKGRLRFETVQPSRSVLIVNGDNGWLHYPELEVTKAFDIANDPVMKLMSEQLAALTRGDFQALKSIYTIEDGNAGKKRLTPKDLNIKKIFKLLNVQIEKNGAVSKVEMVSTNGDTTEIRFENAVFNAALDPALFEAPSPQKGNP